MSYKEGLISDKFFQKHNIKLSLILGSGLELDDEMIKDKQVIKEDNHGVHKRQIYICKVRGVKILVFRGRKHFYEGYYFKEIISNVSLIRESGCRKLLVTNSAGGINVNYKAGDIMIIDSTINLNFRLKFLREGALGMERNNLDSELINAFYRSGIRPLRGVYAYLPGPYYETNSEIVFLRRYYADAVGMSTVPEITYARQHGIKTSGLSVITNLLKENLPALTSHDEVLSTAKNVSRSLSLLIGAFISELK